MKIYSLQPTACKIIKKRLQHRTFLSFVKLFRVTPEQLSKSSFFISIIEHIPKQFPNLTPYSTPKLYPERRFQFLHNTIFKEHLRVTPERLSKSSSFISIIEHIPKQFPNLSPYSTPKLYPERRFQFLHYQHEISFTAALLQVFINILFLT